MVTIVCSHQKRMARLWPGSAGVSRRLGFHPGVLVCRAALLSIGVSLAGCGGQPQARIVAPSPARIVSAQFLGLDAAPEDCFPVLRLQLRNESDRTLSLRRIGLVVRSRSAVREQADDEGPAWIYQYHFLIEPDADAGREYWLNVPDLIPAGQQFTLYPGVGIGREGGGAQGLLGLRPILGDGLRSAVYELEPVVEDAQGRQSRGRPLKVRLEPPPAGVRPRRMAGYRLEDRFAALKETDITVLGSVIPVVGVIGEQRALPYLRDVQYQHLDVALGAYERATAGRQSATVPSRATVERRVQALLADAIRRLERGGAER